MIIHKYPRELMFFQTNGGSSGIAKGKGRAKKSAEPTVHGVPQSEIDAKKGVQDHASPHSISWQDVQAQYAKVGIQVTDQYAKDVHGAVQSFSGAGYTPMRAAMLKLQKGEPLSPTEQQWLDSYKLCEEWCKVAPTFSSPMHSVIYRGIALKSWVPNSVAYMQKIKTLKPGDMFDLDRMPSSFSSELHTAKSFVSGKGNIIVHMSTSSLKNAPSIKGLSLHPYEDEILVGDYGSRVTKIDDQTGHGDGYYHIYI